MGKLAPKVVQQPGESKAQAHCRARTELVHRVLEGGDADLRLLNAHIGAWRKHWRSHIIMARTPEKVTEIANLSVNRITLRTCRPLLVFGGFILAMALGPLLIGRSAQFWWFGFLLMPIAGLSFMTYLRPNYFLLRSVVHGTCPDCEYSLKELPDAIELPGETRTGPAKCPECGCPWPLIPPRPPD